MANAFKRGLRGKHTHMDPLKALEGLTPENARMVPSKGTHSCWHILYHIVYWQELMLTAIKGEEVDWPKNNEESWPTNKLLERSKDWVKLVEKFENGLNEAENLTRTLESTEDLPAWPKVPPFAAFLVLAQHNSFHIGEIVATRQALGIWPPPDYKAMF
ncbi:MAG: DinB family protein [Candidatus Thorarchaeota archaeon]|nr:DinB family protein [Candidatus Thorarchaeota archaeon]